MTSLHWKSWKHLSMFLVFRCTIIQMNIFSRYKQSISNMYYPKSIWMMSMWLTLLCSIIANWARIKKEKYKIPHCTCQQLDLYIMLHWPGLIFFICVNKACQFMTNPLCKIPKWHCNTCFFLLQFHFKNSQIKHWDWVYGSNTHYIWLLWLESLLFELHISYLSPTRMCDNLSTICYHIILYSLLELNTLN